MPNIKKTSPHFRRYSLRLIIAIPTIIFISTLITGLSFYALTYQQLLSRTTIDLQHIDLFMQRWRILFGGVLIFSFAVGVLLSFYILSPLSNITRSFKNFLEGREMQPLRLRSTDELGELSSSYNSIVSYLSNYTLSQEAVLDSLGAGILFLNLRMEITYINHIAREILDYRGKLPISLNRLIPLKENAKFYYHLGLGKSNAVIEEEEAEVYLVQREKVLLKYSISRFKKKEDLSREREELIVTFKDVLHFENIQKRILQAEQLAIVGGLSAGIAHEVKNPLGSIRALVQLLSEDILEDGKNPEYSDYFDRIYSEVQRLDRVINNVLFFSQIKNINLQPVDINTLIKIIVDDCHNQHPDKSIKVFYNMSPTLGTFWGDEDKLYQAFMNIIKNAFEFMKPQNVLSVETKNKKIEPNITPHSFILNNQGVKNAFKLDGGIEIVISNTGTEIPVPIQEKIFNPFFTTRDCGSGLGLAIAKQVVDAHCGYLDARSDSQRTTFIIGLPAFISKDQT